MIALAWHTVRARWASLAGSFIAVALGVALLASMALIMASTVGAPRHPRWFTRPDVVVAGDNSVSITTGLGDNRDTSSETTDEARAVPAALARRLAGLGAGMVVDYAASATAAGVPGDTVHPWSAAALHSYTWLSGGPPRAAGQIVLTAPVRLRPGATVAVQTAAGPRRFTVSGVIRTTAQPAMYASDAVAAGLARGRIGAIALTARPGEPAATLAAQVRVAARGQAVRVLTGGQRRAAEPNPDAALFVVAISLLGVTSGLAGFVAIFVVAGTFAYAVAARRRELGLLRTVGATPRQARRLVLGEALAVAVAAALAGSALGTVIAGPFARWLGRAGFAPRDFTAHFILWPLLAASGAGLLIALSGAFIAARRAGRVRPAEALREAAVDRGTMPLTRWLIALAALAGSVPLFGLLVTAHSADSTALILPVTMLLVVGFAMLAPVLIPPLAWLFSAPVAAVSPATGMLARRSAMTAVRRTAATAAPVLVTVGIAGSLLAGTDTLIATQQDAARARISAPVMITPGRGSAGLADATVAAVRAVPGVTAAVPVTNTMVYVPSGGDPDQWPGQYIGGPGLAAVTRFPVVAGSLSDLTGTGTVAVPAGTWRLGQTVSLWLDDSAPVKLRVVALLADQIDTEQTVLLPWALRDAHTATPLAGAIYLRLAPGARLAAVRVAAAAGGGTLSSTAAYQSASDAQNSRANTLALIAILGMALVYTGIAIANTLVMATATRNRELAALRLSGALPRQVIRMIGVEALLVSGIGMLFAAAVTAATVIGLHHGLAPFAPSVRLVVPWLPLGVIALACLVIALLASMIPAGLALRRPPLELAGARE
jgi:putative ABC transport system permease protein